MSVVPARKLNSVEISKHALLLAAEAPVQPPQGSRLPETESHISWCSLSHELRLGLSAASPINCLSNDKAEVQGLTSTTTT